MHQALPPSCLASTHLPLEMIPQQGQMQGLLQGLTPCRCARLAPRPGELVAATGLSPMLSILGIRRGPNSSAWLPDAPGSPLRPADTPESPMRACSRRAFLLSTDGRLPGRRPSLDVPALEPPDCIEPPPGPLRAGSTRTVDLHHDQPVESSKIAIS